MTTDRKRRGRGEGSLGTYDTTSGPRWYAKWQALQEDGTRKAKLKRGFATKTEAQRFLRDELKKADDGVVAKPPEKRTVGEWLDEWVEGLRLAPSTEASYRKNVRLHLKPRLGSIQLTRLTGPTITSAYRKMETDGRLDHKAGEGLSPRTVRYCHQILRRALADAGAAGLIPTNPADLAKPPSVSQAKAPEMHPWNVAHLSTFLDWADEAAPAHAPGWRLLAYTGMRRGECLALRWKDVDLETGRLSVRRSIGVVKVPGRGKTIIEGPTKGKRARVVDLDADTVEMLRRWRRERAAISLHLARDEAPVFGTLEGEWLHPERFSARFVEKQAQCRRALGEAAPPAIKLHDLRHTHATLLLAGGVPVKVVSERLGHASVMITLDTYAHVMPGMQAEAAATFARLMGGGA